MVEYGTTNMFMLDLEMFEFGDEGELRDLLAPLSAAIRAAHARIDEVATVAEQAGDDGRNAQLFIDDQCGYLEVLLGATFVVMQRYVTITTSRITLLAKRVKRATGHKNGVFALPDHEIRQNYGPTCPGAPAQRLANGVFAAGNLFKHESERDYPWTDLVRDDGTVTPAVLTDQNCHTLPVTVRSSRDFLS